MPTIYDVAKTAGVSPKTVSRVLNGSELVRESTRLAVSKAMEELDYVPSSAARTLRSNRSGLVGLVTNALAGVFDRPDQAGLPDLVLVQAIQQRLESTGLTLLIADSGGNQERVATLLRTFAEHRVEGAFYVAQFHQKVSLPTTTGLPHVVVVNGFDSTQSPSVSPNDYAGQHALVERLIAAGHRRIAYLTLPTPYCQQQWIAGCRWTTHPVSSAQATIAWRCACSLCFDHADWKCLATYLLLATTIIA